MSRLNELTYCNLSPEPVDFLGEIIPSMGISLKASEADAIGPDEKVVVNCIWTPPHRLESRIAPRSSDGAMLIITEENHAEAYRRFGRVLSLPASYGSLRSACEEMAQHLDADVFSPAVPAQAASLYAPGSKTGQFDKAC